jgi:hypothetical protein
VGEEDGQAEATGLTGWKVEEGRRKKEGTMVGAQNGLVAGDIEVGVNIRHDEHSITDVLRPYGVCVL